MSNSALAGQFRASREDLLGRYAAFLERWRWQLWGTLTSKRPMGEARAEEVWHRFEREVRYRLGHRFDFVRVKEPFDTRPGVHIHFLALDCDGLHRLDLVRWCWPLGWTEPRLGKLDLQVYNPAIGAGGYLTKYVVKDNSDSFDIRFSPMARKWIRSKQDCKRPVLWGAGLVGDRLVGTRAYCRSHSALGAAEVGIARGQVAGFPGETSAVVCASDK